MLGISESLVLPELQDSYLKTGAFSAVNLAGAIGIKGPVTVTAGGLQAIFEASQIIRQGEADIMVVLGASPEITEETLDYFSKFKVLSSKNDYSVFSGEGMVLGEGSGAIVLENYQHAVDRNAKIYCELSNYCQIGSKVLYKPTEKVPINGDVVIANSSGTAEGDKTEAEMLIGQKRVTSIKANTGWILSASGIIDAAVGALMIYQSIVPPVYFNNSKYPLNLVNNLQIAQLQKVAVHSIDISGQVSSLEISKTSI
jgi:3-oxoacyl-[acyl-carrier-protein] synthase II